MALSGNFSVTSSTGSGYTYKVVWTATQSITNNTSTITMTHYLICGSGWSLSISSSSSNYSQVNSSDTKYYTSPAISTNGGSTTTLGTTTHTVSHNTDGSKSVTLKGYMANSYLGSPTATSTVTLDTIPRASSISSVTSSVSMTGSATCTVGISSNSSSFYHKVKFVAPNSYATTWVSVTSGSTSPSIVYTVPLSWNNSIPSATSGTVTATLYTYSDSAYSTVVGSGVSTTFTVTVPTSVVPTISALTLTRNALNDSSGWGIYLKGYTGAKATAGTCAGIYSSTIKSITISGGGYSTSSTSTFTGLVLTTGVLNTSGTNTFTATVTDSRGRTATKTASITVTSYSLPSISSISAYRCTSSGSSSDTGTYIYLKATGTINSNGTRTLKAYYKKSTASSYTSVTLTSASASIVGSGAIDTDSSYDVYYTCSDGFKTISSSVITVPSSSSVIDIKSDGKGIAFGGSAETSNMVEIKGGWGLSVDGETVMTPKTIAIPSSEVPSGVAVAAYVETYVYPTLPTGFSFVFIQYNGGYGQQFIVTKTSSLYGSILGFGYSLGSIYNHRLLNGVWSTTTIS